MLYVQNEHAINLNNLLYGKTDTLPPMKGLNSYINFDYKEFYNHFFNIKHAVGQGLDNWGIILNTSRNIQDINYPTNKIIKFNHGDTNISHYKPAFGFGGFDYVSGIGYRSVDDNFYRCMLMLRYQTFTSNMSILNITDILNNFFANLLTYHIITNEQTVSVQDNISEMSITYTFNGALTSLIKNIFVYPYSSTYYLPVPLGMKENIIYT